MVLPSRRSIRPATMENDISLETALRHTDPALWFPKQELAQRQHILEDLRDRRIGHLPPGSLFADTGVRDSEP